MRCFGGAVQTEVNPPDAVEMALQHGVGIGEIPAIADEGEMQVLPGKDGEDFGELGMEGWLAAGEVDVRTTG